MTQIVILSLLTLGLLAGLIIFVSGLIANLRTRVPYVPTHIIDIHDMIERAGLTAADTFVDLGSGNGRVVFAVERESGARVRGYELPSWMFWYAQLKKRLTHSQAELVSGNFFNQSWSDATVVYCYLLPSLMPRLSAKIRHEVAPGTKVISRDFPIPDLELVNQWKTPSKHTIYLYRL